MNAIKAGPFEKEIDLESAITEIQHDLFGSSRVYLEVKKLIGRPGRVQNIPDGYLLDFSSPKKPVLYIVEVELAKHDPLRHIAQQLLGFSLSFKSTPTIFCTSRRDLINRGDSSTRQQQA